MPRFIPVTIYEQRTICTGRPPKFTGRPDAIQWAVAQGAFDIKAACAKHIQG